MSGVAFTLTTPGLDEAIAKLRGLVGFDMAELADNAGALIESGTRRRLQHEKSAPDGTPWEAWSEAYDETRNHDKHSLLVGEGDLLDSVQSYSTGDQAIVGSNLVYAAIQNLGGEEVGRDIPQREFLGLSAQDALDLNDLVTGTWEDLLQ
jgi:phage virion morphogenesis protein